MLKSPKPQQFPQQQDPALPPCPIVEIQVKIHARPSINNKSNFLKEGFRSESPPSSLTCVA